MIRQLGPALLFCSFSSAETQWIHLQKILGKLLYNKEYCGSELFNQPLYFCTAYPKFSNWQASCYSTRTTVPTAVLLCCIPKIFKLAGLMLLKSNYCALTAPPKLALYSFSRTLPSLNLQYSNF